MISSPLKNVSVKFPPINLESYLLSNGWIAEGEILGQAKIWHRADKDHFDFEVLQPKSTEIQGYCQRVIDAINELAIFENRDPHHILKEIENFFSDSVKIRVIHSDVEEGTIPIDDGVLLIEKSRDLLTATTLSTFSKKSYFTGQRNAEAKNFIKQLRLGQTEVGSFIVNLIAPISDTINTQVEQDKMSITRAITNNLSRSLVAIGSGLESYKRTESIFEFESVVNNGVSANLCDALIGLTGITRSRSFTINICRAGVELDTQELPTEFKFSPEQVPLLELASAFYKGNYVIKAYEAFGLVSKMTHLFEDDFGEITVRSSIHGIEKNVTIQLKLAEYWQAVHAHENAELISCSGVLHVTAKSAKLLEPSNFKVIGKIV
ncbi:hypothetical protein CJP16_14975 [Aeromonas sobria]|uniref:Uncharacterized protein n=1 Tax=Aeromonas sobria TaxID=646 RepID=A0A2N3ITY9_AERSO|nr:hypothetical protein [Aeromonas sobria]PKQ75412.1 hypothetical protein CJP16_14975 [Aeromonas sobria]